MPKNQMHHVLYKNANTPSQGYQPAVHSAQRYKVPRKQVESRQLTGTARHGIEHANHHDLHMTGAGFDGAMTSSIHSPANMRSIAQRAGRTDQLHNIAIRNESSSLNQNLKTESRAYEENHIEQSSILHDRLPEIGVSNKTVRQATQSSIGDNHKGLGNQKQPLVRSSIAQYEDEGYNRRSRKMNINGHAENSPNIISMHHILAANQMNKFKVEQIEASSYSSSIYQGAGSVHENHFARSPSQLQHVSGANSQAVNRLNQSNEYCAPPMKSDSTCMLPKISSVIGNIAESQPHLDSNNRFQ